VACSFCPFALFYFLLLKIRIALWSRSAFLALRSNSILFPFYFLSADINAEVVNLFPSLTARLYQYSRSFTHPAFREILSFSEASG